MNRQTNATIAVLLLLLYILKQHCTSSRQLPASTTYSSLAMLEPSDPRPPARCSRADHCPVLPLPYLPPNCPHRPHRLCPHGGGVRLLRSSPSHAPGPGPAAGPDPDLGPQGVHDSEPDPALDPAIHDPDTDSEPEPIRDAAVQDPDSEPEPALDPDPGPEGVGTGAIIHAIPSDDAVNIPSTRMNSCPGRVRTESSVPCGKRWPGGGRSGIWGERCWANA